MNKYKNENLPAYVAIYHFPDGCVYWVNVHTQKIYFTETRYAHYLVRSSAYDCLPDFMKRLRQFIKRQQ